MIVKMRKVVSSVGVGALCLVMVCCSVFAGDIDVPDSLPVGVLAHVAVASPRSFLKDLDDSVSAATSNLPEIQYSPGMISMLATMFSPLPVAAWHDDKSVHVFFLTVEAGAFTPAILFQADSLDDIREALNSESEVFSHRGMTVLEADMGGEIGDLYIAQLAEGEFAAVKRLQDLSWFAKLVEDRDFTGAPESGLVIYIDLLSVQRSFGIDAGLLFDMAEWQYGGKAEQILLDIQARRDAETDPEMRQDLDRLEAMWEGAGDAWNILRDRVEDVADSLQVLAYSLDFKDKTLRIGAAVSVDKETRLGKISEQVAERAVPSFPHAGLMPENSFLYQYYSLPQPVIEDLTRFFLEIATAVLGEKSELAAAMKEQADFGLQAELIDYATAASPGPDKQMRQFVAARFGHPEKIPQMRDKSISQFAQIQDKLLAVAGKYVVRSYEEDIEKTDYDDPELKQKDLEWLAGLQEKGLEPVMALSVDRGEYGSDKIPYQRIGFAFNLRQFIRPSKMDALNESALAMLDRFAEQMLVLSVLKGDIMLTATLSEGRQADVNAEVAELLAVFDPAHKGFSAVADSVHPDAPRQATGAIMRPAELVIYNLLQSFATMDDSDGDDQIDAALLDVLAEFQGQDAFAYSYGGADGNVLQATFALPAQTVRLMLKSYYAHADALKDAFNRLGAMADDDDDIGVYEEESDDEAYTEE